MRRLVVLAAVLGFLAAVPLSHLVLAAPNKGKKPKAKICHVSALGPIAGQTGDFFLGEVIEISGNALKAHCNNHGDFQGLDFDNVDIATKAVGDPCARAVADTTKSCNGQPAKNPKWYSPAG
jgi:hypothetical protein